MGQTCSDYIQFAPKFDIHNREKGITTLGIDSEAFEGMHLAGQRYV